MTFTLPRRVIRAMLTVAPTTDVRYYLNGMHLRGDARGIIAEATDGHVMLRARVDATPQAPAWSLILPRAAIEPLAGKGKRTLDEVVTVDASDPGAVIIREPDGTVRTVQSVDGTYPDTDRVTPVGSARPPIEPAQYNPALLSRVHAALQLLGAAETDVQIRQHGDKPSLVTASGLPEVLAVIMPWRQEEATAPGWSLLTADGGAR
jgi:hypothetical protein